MKGFSLVEMVAVIIVLSVISLITFPIINSSIKKSKEVAYEKQVDIILASAKKWSVENVDLLPVNDTGKVYVSIDDLVNGGFIKNDEIINPINNMKMDGCVLIKFTSTYNQHTYEYTTCS